MSSPLPAPDPQDRVAHDPPVTPATGATGRAAGRGTAGAPGAAPEPGAAAGHGAAADPGAPGRRLRSLPPAGGGAVDTTPDGVPKLYRSSSAVVGGVAAGVAEHLGVPVVWVRLAFAVLGAFAGAGVVFYALLWMVVPMAPAAERRSPEPPVSAAARRRDRSQALGVAAVGVALLMVSGALGFGQALGWILGPLGVAAIGAAFIWREADDTRRARWRRSAAGSVTPRMGTWWRLAGGVALVVGGLVVFALGQFPFAAVRSALVAVLLTLVGVAVITVPWWLRLIRTLGEERRERIAEGERAEIAAHLHDSVLQTLALIQRQAGDAREVARLARGQERELRAWLYGPAGYAAAGGRRVDVEELFSQALTRAAGEVEDTYAVRVSPVVVGDATLNAGLAALVAAAREAMVNAAKHSGQEELSVYAEIEDGTATVFVRDRGRGFDPTAVDADRRGLAESIRGRMQRHGGIATVRSSPGEGAEVVLTIAVQEHGDGPPVDLRKGDGHGTGAAERSPADQDGGVTAMSSPADQEEHR